MSIDVTIYIDYRSPYSYLAKAEASALARDFGARLDWLPFAIDLRGAYGGEVQERSERDWRKVRYLYMDARRLANRQGLTVLGPKKIFDPTVAHIGHLFAKAHGILPAYHQTVSERFWRRALDIEDRRAIAAVLAEIGGDPASFERYLAGPGPEDYAAMVATAEQRGVFGVPTFVLDDELFWGTDRIGLLRERLAAKHAAGTSPQ
jgi:2-hydroxychromene-2-carboxylate isomerase